MAPPSKRAWLVSLWWLYHNPPRDPSHDSSTGYGFGPATDRPFPLATRPRRLRLRPRQRSPTLLPTGVCPPAGYSTGHPRRLASPPTTTWPRPPTRRLLAQFRRRT